MKKIYLLLGFFLFASAPEAFAFRCGQRIVQTGDHISDVRIKCGEPDYADKRLGVSGSRFRFPQGTLDISEYQQITIDEWIYNFGPRRLKQQLIFENGILMDIRSIGYGN
ncbi:MAG: DUF2845 domain-containing protein [Gammaproteobacteria bacterium]|uniref:DUF2845 domain-containing protein n=1 Tax=unclassified Methylotuvimicrobium TaxID=2822412 RepID=UPI001E0FCBA9|nr:DUF2845 domain-containing protein [Gammaproteobacteria bacterium]